MYLSECSRKSRTVLVLETASWGQPNGSGEKKGFKKMRRRKTQENPKKSKGTKSMLQQLMTTDNLADNTSNQKKNSHNRVQIDNDQVQNATNQCTDTSIEAQEVSSPVQSIKRSSALEPNQKKKKRCFITDTGKDQLDDVSAAGLLKLPSQRSVALCQRLGPKPPQPEPQTQCYELIKRTAQIKRCNGCNELFAKDDKGPYILGRNELDWYVSINKEQNTKIYKVTRRNFYYCVKRRCVLARRPLINPGTLDIKAVGHIEKTGKPGRKRVWYVNL